jgi:hypothetical protein
MRINNRRGFVGYEDVFFQIKGTRHGLALGEGIKK